MPGKEVGREVAAAAGSTGSEAVQIARPPLVAIQSGESGVLVGMIGSALRAGGPFGNGT